MKKSFILATSAALLLASCGTTKGALDKAPTSAFAEKKYSDDTLKNWPHQGFKQKFPGINLDEAYALLKNLTPKKIIVGVVDSGVDINHEDLKNVIWTNTAEIPNNGKDDDKNGYVDDIH